MVAVAAILAGWTGRVLAQLPVARLTTILPAGGKVGTEFAVKITGGDLDDVDRLVFSHQGITASPKMYESVKVHYAGWLTDGTPFDDSFSRGVPFEARLGQVIPGWNEGLQLMKPGDAYWFVIPGDLAYGQRGSASKIGPDATLVFYVELLK